MRDLKKTTISKVLHPPMESLLSIQQANSSRIARTGLLSLVADQARLLTNSRHSWVLLEQASELVVAARSCAPLRMSGEADAKERKRTPGNSTNQPGMGRTSECKLPLCERAKILLNLKDTPHLCIPIQAGETHVGLIMVSEPLDTEYQYADEQSVGLLSAAVLLVLENSRLYQEEQIRRRQAEGLRDLLAILNKNQPLNQVLNIILVRACALLGGQAGVVFRIFPERGEGKPIAAYGDEALFQEENFVLFNPEISRVLRQRFWIKPTGETSQDIVVSDSLEDALPFEPVVISDLNGSLDDIERIANLPQHQLHYMQYLCETFQTSLTVPLLIKEAPWGILELFFADKRRFTDDEVKFAIAMGNQVSLAIERDQWTVQSRELAQLQERRRIAQALHDSVAQMLFSIGLETKRCIDLEDSGEKIGKELDLIHRLAARSSEELRSAIFALQRNEVKDGNGLVELLQELVTDFRKDTGIAAMLIAPPQLGTVSPIVGEAIYRIVREALSNVRKHAAASATVISLSRRNRELVVAIQDNGKGLSGPMDGENEQLHFGVATMQEVANKAGGDFEMGENEDGGVTIRARFSVEVEKEL